MNEKTRIQEKIRNEEERLKEECSKFKNKQIHEKNTNATNFKNKQTDMNVKKKQTQSNNKLTSSISPNLGVVINEKQGSHRIVK